MKLVVLNGSPKGKNSVTMHYVGHLARKFSSHSFTVLSISHRIERILNDDKEYQRACQAIEEADGVIWAFPVYVYWTPAQVVRFLELVLERGDQKIFAGKFATTITTSVQVFDHTAHEYIQQVCEDWGMVYTRGFSAEMYDLLDDRKRHNLELFFERFVRRFERRSTVPVFHSPITASTFQFVAPAPLAAEKTGTRQVLLLSDATDRNGNLLAMIEVFRDRSASPVEVLELDKEMGSSAWCLGCLHCMPEGKCIRNDDFSSRVVDRIKRADALVIASRIGVRGHTSSLKRFLDRLFVEGYREPFRGKPVALLISGPLRQVPNFAEALLANVERKGATDYLVITDECEDSERLVAQIDALADELNWTLETGLEMPRSFLAVGASLILRDFVFRNRKSKRMDHYAFLEKGVYDFPTWEIGSRLVNRLGLMALSIPAARRWMNKNLKRLATQKLDERFPMDVIFKDRPDRADFSSESTSHSPKNSLRV